MQAEANGSEKAFPGYPLQMAGWVGFPQPPKPYPHTLQRPLRVPSDFLWGCVYELGCSSEGEIIPVGLGEGHPPVSSLGGSCGGDRATATG